MTPEDFAACLADLATVNIVTLAKGPTLRWLARATRHLPQGSKISVLDIGFGHGDMLRAIWRWCRKRGFQAELRGFDLNPLSEPAARQATVPGMKIDFRTGDVFSLPEDERVDFIISSLVTHHMTDPQIVAFLRWMNRPSRARVVHQRSASRMPCPITPFAHFLRSPDGTVSCAMTVRYRSPAAFVVRIGCNIWRKPVSRAKFAGTCRSATASGTRNEAGRHCRWWCRCRGRLPAGEGRPTRAAH